MALRAVRMRALMNSALRTAHQGGWLRMVAVAKGAEHIFWLVAPSGRLALQQENAEAGSAYRMRGAANLSRAKWGKKKGHNGGHKVMWENTTT